MLRLRQVGAGSSPSSRTVVQPEEIRQRGRWSRINNGVKELIDQILVSHRLVHALDSTESLPASPMPAPSLRRVLLRQRVRSSVDWGSRGRFGGEQASRLCVAGCCVSVAWTWTGQVWWRRGAGECCAWELLQQERARLRQQEGKRPTRAEAGPRTFPGPGIVLKAPFVCLPASERSPSQVPDGAPPARGRHRRARARAGHHPCRAGWWARTGMAPAPAAWPAAEAAVRAPFNPAERAVRAEDAGP